MQRSMLIYSLVLLCTACKPDDGEEWPTTCETVETVAASWMGWKAAVGEFGHRYRYLREVQVPGIGAEPYCLYHTLIEIDGDVVISREFTMVGTSGGITCEEGWVELGGEVGSHGSESDAAPALTLEAVYENCCAVINPAFGYFYDDNLVGSYALISWCGDAYCDDGGCSDGPAIDTVIRSIEFLQ